MRRIYLESILSLLFCFILSTFLYEVAVYQLTTDYEYVLEEYEAEAYQKLVDEIVVSQGLPAALQAIDTFAATTRSIVSAHLIADTPTEVLSYFSSPDAKDIFYDKDRALWFRLTGSEAIYLYTPDLDSLVHQKIELEDSLAIVFILGGFLLYAAGYLLIIFKRVKPLEQATLKFSEGDMSVRASTSNGKAIGTLNQSFNIMADRISQLIQSHQSLTNAVAHELRTPLFRIQWQAELLKDLELNAKQKKVVESIIEDSEEMEEMVDELLHYAKLDRGSVELTTERIALKPILDNSLHRWRKSSQVVISLSFIEPCIEIDADKKLLLRALDNLVGNAIKYAQQQVIIKVDAKKGQAVIAIEDDGVGVDQEHWPYLFDPFYVVDKARNRGSSGFGLGLAIVKKICEQHGAKVDISRSNALHGACFTVTFPLCNPKSDKAIQ